MRNPTLISIFLGIVFVQVCFSQTLVEQWVVCGNNVCEVLDPYYSEGVELEWEGDCLDGKANGYGVLKKYYEGEWESTYEGYYKRGIREGRGVFTHVDGTVARGNFIDGQLMGYGTRTRSDGSKYEGNFVNYREHGDGVLFLANGSRFEGKFVSDRLYSGKLVHHDGQVTGIHNYKKVDIIPEYASNYKPELEQLLTEYFDKDWKRCQKSNASFFRQVRYAGPNIPVGLVRDYYITGELQSEFHCIYIDYADEELNFHEGEASWFYKNGSVEQIRYYYNNKINGDNTFFYDNGQIKDIITWKHGIRHGTLKSYFRNGMPRIFAIYEEGRLYDNRYMEFDETGMAQIIYFEPFLLNENNWVFIGENSVSAINTKGELEFSLQADRREVRFNYISLSQDRDFTLETIIQRKTGTDGYAYGLLFGFKDWNNYYEFSISEWGSFIISGKLEGINYTIKDWTRSDVIRTGNQRNQLKILKIGSDIIFSINGDIVFKVEAPVLRGNNYGLIAGGRGDYTMESLVVKEFVDPTVDGSANIDGTKMDDDGWQGNGSGIIFSRDGHIITNNHVIENAREIFVEFNYRDEVVSFRSELLIADPSNDLAILKVKDVNFDGFNEIPYSLPARSADVGTSVFALGYPMALSVMGREVKFTDGKISSKSGYQGDVRTYQTTVPIQPGNSGGPLFDYEGNLIGINTSILKASVAENVAYSIKSSYILALIDALDQDIEPPSDRSLALLGLTDQIKVLSNFVVMVKTR